MAGKVGSGRRAPWRLVFRGRRGLATGIILTAIGMHAIDVFVMSTVMPSVVRDIGGAAFYAWPTLVYMVATIVGAATAGPLQATRGLRTGYITAAGLFGCGAVVGALSPSIGVLIIGRAVQGWGGGLLLALSIVLVRTLYADRLRPRVFAIISTLWGAAALVGPAVGGIFAEIGWWRGAFWYQVPVTTLFIVLALRVVPAERTARPARRFPWMALGLLCVGAVAVAAAGNVATAPEKAALIGLGLAMVALALRRDRSNENPMFPSRAFMPVAPAGAIHWVFVLVAMSNTGVGIYLPLVMQKVHGLSPIAAGYFTCFVAMGWTSSAVLVSGFHDRAVRRVMITGPFVAGGALLLVSRVIVHGSLFELAPLLVAVGSGIGMCLPHYTTRILRVALKGEEAVTASSVTTVRSLGIAFGAALAGMIANLAGLSRGLDVTEVSAAAHWVTFSAAAMPLIAGAMGVWLITAHGRELGLAPRAGV